MSKIDEIAVLKTQIQSVKAGLEIITKHTTYFNGQLQIIEDIKKSLITLSAAIDTSDSNHSSTDIYMKTIFNEYVIKGLEQLKATFEKVYDENVCALCHGEKRADAFNVSMCSKVINGQDNTKAWQPLCTTCFKKEVNNTELHQNSGYPFQSINSNMGSKK